MNHYDDHSNNIVGWSLGVIFGFAILLLTLTIVSYNNPSKKEICADVGGEYKVVGQEYSAANKMTIDVYGCVK